jgi:hypothetical protein
MNAPVITNTANTANTANAANTASAFTAATAATMATAAVATVGSATWIVFLKFIVMTGILLTALILMFTLGNLNEIRKNFPRYRCNPLFMPFASNFGYDTKDNFNFCLSTIFDSKAAEIFAPIYQLLGGFVSLTKLIVDVALGIRKLFSNFLLGVNGFVQNVRDRIQQLLFSIRMSFMRMQHLMNRVYGTMYAVVWMGTSAITAGFNISDNSLVQFLFEFCFDPQTTLLLADGSVIAIKDAKLGMKLAPTPANSAPEITSLFEFDGSQTSMVTIDGVTMSSAHYVLVNECASTSASKWIPASAHPRALPVPSIPQLICLNVTGHEFIVGNSGIVVADYDEHGSSDVILQTQQLAEQRLNGCASGASGASGASKQQPPNDYELGIDPAAEVYMKDGSWKQLDQIQLGDIVWNAGRVCGLVTESVNNVVTYNSIEMSASQLVYDCVQNKWIRNLSDTKSTTISKQFKQIITLNGSAFTIRSPFTKDELFVRDYREISDPEMESAYADKFLEKSAVV